MRTYVFFDKNTGNIVHVHAEATLSGESPPVPKEKLLAMDLRQPSEARFDKEGLDVLEVDLNLRRRRQASKQQAIKELYVDVDKRVLSERDTRQERR